MKKIFIVLLLVTGNQYSKAQNVGIGTDAPSEKLHVAGNIKTDTLKTTGLKITPNAATGKILTSDAAGNATWQTNTTTGNGSGSAAGNIGYGVWGDCATNGNISEYQPVADTAGGGNFQFGESITMSGNFAAIGNSAEDVAGIVNAGVVSIYEHNGSQWEFKQKLVDPTGETNGFFGTSISMSGNFLIVGSYVDDVGTNVNQGSVCIFQYNASNWVFQQKITDALGETNDYFGYAVSISGNFALIGAYSDDNGVVNPDRGSVSFYRFNGSTWVLVRKYFDPSGGVNDYFGRSVSISGDYAVAGSYGEDDAETDQGSITVFKYDGVSNWVSEGKIKEAIPKAYNEFGRYVSNYESDIAVGIARHNTNGIITEANVKLYRRINGNYTLSKTLFPDNEDDIHLGFGESLSITGKYLIVGLPSKKVELNSSAGEALIYQRVGNGWQKLQTVIDPGNATNGNFGQKVAIDGAIKRFMLATGTSTLLNTKVVFGKIN